MDRAELKAFRLVFAEQFLVTLIQIPGTHTAECQGQNLARSDFLDHQHIGNPVDDHGCFAAARNGQQQTLSVRANNRFFLLFIEFYFIQLFKFLKIIHSSYYI